MVHEITDVITKENLSFWRVVRKRLQYENSIVPKIDSLGY